MNSGDELVPRPCDCVYKVAMEEEEKGGEEEEGEVGAAEEEGVKRAGLLDLGWTSL